MNGSPFGRGRRLAVLTLVAVASTVSVGAFFPFYVGSWTAAYPTSSSLDHVLNGTGDSCQLCHRDGNGGNGWNAYGWEIKEIFNQTGDLDMAILDAEGVDSDGDGNSNIDEIDADTQPGWTPGPNNTIFFNNGSTQTNQNPPAGILGDLDPADDPWVDLGFGLAGTNGVPLLVGGGTLAPNSPLSITLTGALPGSTAYLVAGWDRIDLPFYCGTMVPSFFSPTGLYVTLPTFGGTIPINDTWPTGVPSGFVLYLQYWVDDPGSLCGLAASNAISGTTP